MRKLNYSMQLRESFLLLSLLEKCLGESLDCVDCDRKCHIVNIFVNMRLHDCPGENNRSLGPHKGRCNRKVMTFSHNYV